MTLSPRTFRRVVMHAAALAALAGWVACRASNDHPSDTAATAAATASAKAPEPASNGGTLEDLSFSGAVSGHMTSGRKGGVYFCGKMGPRFVADPVQGDIGRTPFNFSVTIADGYKGPGTYHSGKELPPGSGVAAVTVGLTHAGGDSKEFVNGTGANTVVVNGDERSGSVTADLHGTGKTAGAVHVSGTWRCPPD